MTETSSEPDFVRSFREAAPYIHYLRGKTLVVGISGSLLHGRALADTAADLNLLCALGVRLVLVFGLDGQLPERPVHQGFPLTDAAALATAKQLCGSLQADIQAALAVGFAHSPQRAPRLRVLSGSFVFARALGVIDGTDTGFTGLVRKIDKTAVRAALDTQAAILIAPVAASRGGQSYLIDMPALASAAAVSLEAEKLLFLTEETGIRDAAGSLIGSMTADEADALLSAPPAGCPAALLRAAVDALRQGVSRVQILSGRQSGDLLRELFTRHGAGTAVAPAPFVSVRPAKNRDIADIAALIRPLEEQGILLPRSRLYLEEHIRSFYVLENDRQIYGCAELKTFPSTADAAELACLAVADNIRNSGYGEQLLARLAQEAARQGKTRLFALSTHTADWFAERGFQAASPEELPPERLASYRANGRRSKVFVLDISGAA